jgi:methyl-accepting chemotaxis protein
MFAKMRLSLKMAIGFGLVLLIAAIIGYTGWTGLRDVMSGVQLAAIGTDVGMATEQCGKFRRDFELYGAAEYGKDRKTAAERWQGSFDKLKGALSALMADATLAPQYRERVAATNATVDGYREAFGELNAARQVQDKAFASWTEIGWRVTKQIETARQVIDPLVADAARSKDAVVFERISAIQKKLDEEVIADFLLLRVNAVYYLATKKDEQWVAYQTQLRKAKAAASGWAAQNRDNARLEGTAAMIVADLAEYEAAGEQEHQGVVDQNRVSETLGNVANSIVTQSQALSASLRADMAAASARAAQVMLFLAFAGILLGLALAVVITRSIVKPIGRIIDNLGNGADQTASAAGQVSAASQTLAEGASEQAASLEEASSSLEEIASMTRQNAGNAQHASALMNETAARVTKGQDSMGRLRAAIADIKKSSDETARIVKTIDEIAFQTNILALNAAVEAARAGEAGRGFSVVAEEVRNLAQRSAEAARNTAALIESSVRDSERGVSVAGETAEALSAITEAADKVKSLVGEIAAASQEQSQGIEQVSTSVGQMDNVTQQTAANAEESASAAEELNSQAEQLRAMILELGTLISGAGAAAARSTLTQAIHHLPHAVVKAGARTKQLMEKTRAHAPALGHGPAGHLAAHGQAPGSAVGEGSGGAPGARAKPEEVIPLDDGDRAELTRF